MPKRNQFRLFNPLLLSMFILLAQGCGGGGGGTSSVGTVDDGGSSSTTTTSSSSDPNDPTASLTVSSPSATVVNTPQSARHQNVQLAYDDSGNGIAVWQSGREYGIKLVYALYDAASGIWSEETTLTGSTNITYFDNYDFSVASTGSSFVVSWEQALNTYDEHLYVAVYSGGNWSATTRIDAMDNQSVVDHKLVASDNGYMLVWEQAYTFFYSSYAGGNWSSAASVSTAPGVSTLLDLDSDGSDYLLTYCEAVFCYSASTSTVAFVNGAWQAPAYLNDYDNTEVVSNGSGYAALWLQSGALYWSRNTTGSSWSAPELLVSSVGTPAIASNGNSYAIAYSQVDAATSTRYIYFSSYDGASWSAAQTVAAAPFAGQLRLVASGADYGLSWLTNSSTNPDLYAAVITGGTPQSAMLLEQGVADVADPAIAATSSGYAYAWIQYDGAATEEVYTRAYGSAGLSAQTSLLQLEHDSPASRPVIAVNDSGQKLAVWRQDYFDPTAEELYQYKSGLFASVYDSGSWGAAKLIQKYGIDPKVVSNGQSFLVSFYSVSSPGGSLYGTVYANGSWDTPTYLGGNVYKSSVATNGSNYVVAWESNISGDWRVSTQMYDDISGWDAFSTRHDDTVGAAYLGKIISNGSGYAMAWTGATTNVAVPYIVYAVVYDSTNGWVRTAIQSDGHNVMGPMIATDGSGYMLVWKDNDTSEILTSRYASQSWTAPLRIDSGTASQPAITSNGSGYAVLWNNYPGIYVNLFDGNSWGGQTDLAQTDFSSLASITANQQGYLVSWAVADTGSQRYARVYDGSAWQQSAELLATEAWDPEAIVGNGSTYVMVYQAANTSGVNDLVYRLFDGVNWQAATPLENSNYEVPFLNTVHVITEGSGYSAVWNQPHDGYLDPAVAKVWYRAFGS